MKYFRQIDAFFNNEMTDVERNAFEHEVIDNMDLKRELHARQISDDIFEFLAENLRDDQLLDLEKQNGSSSPVEQKRHFFNTRQVSFFAVLGILFMIVFGVILFNSKVPASGQPMEEKIQTIKNVPIAEDPSVQSTSNEETQLAKIVDLNTAAVAASHYEQESNLKKPLSRKSESKMSGTRINLEKEREEMANENTRNLELTSNASIASGEEIVYQAVQQITLAPGFHAKAGSSVRAVVKKD